MDKGRPHICREEGFSSLLDALILDKKAIRMEFKEDIIISGKTIHRNKVSRHTRNMKDVFKMLISTRDFNLGVSNMTNKHTCTVGCLHMIFAMILLTHGELSRLLVM